MIAALVIALGAVPQQDPDFAAVVASEQRRAAVIEKCAAAVCSVMSMDAPGGGSGVVFDAAGFVLTNYHVVGDADKEWKAPTPPEPPEADLAAFRAAHADATADQTAAFVAEWQAAWREDHVPHGASHYKNKKVGLPDGQLYEAEVLGIDPGSDLAVLRLLPKKAGQTWPFARLGDSDALLVGETVFAMGNPFLLATDFTPTVTFGIVSGTHRYQEGQGQRMLVYPDCIQVDAPVNPGNSGGPLFNEAGEIVGINGRISIGDRGRVNVGVGFAIASNQIKNFLADLMAGRHAEHGTMDMSAWFMNSIADKRRGVFVQQMFKDSVSAAAGIGLGDEITRFNDVEVRSANQLATMIGVLPANTFVSVWYRPALGENGFGDEKRVVLRLATLDTGSSRDGVGAAARLANRLNRRRAAEAVSWGWGAEMSPWGPIGWTRTAPDGTRTQAVRDPNFGGKERCRLVVGDLALVHDGERCHATQGGTKRDPTAEEAERLRREFRSNPMLWDPAAIGGRLQGTELIGGVYVFGAPAYRFLFPGDGECEAWLFADGSPAGCAFRDPLRRASRSSHVRGKELRVVVDGKLEPGWSGSEQNFVKADEDPLEVR